MNKIKDINFRLTEIDFEFLRKMSIKHKITISEQLRRIIKAWRDHENNR